MKKMIACVGDYYHREEWARQSLEAALARLLGEELNLQYVEASDLSDALDENPDLVLLFKENRINPEDQHVQRWMDAGVSDKIEHYVREGGVWLAWHSGLASYPEDSGYVRMLKGRFVHHPAQHQVTRYLPAAESDAPPFAILDEHYFVQCREEDTEVFLRSESVDGASVAGWRHRHGAGRVCCLTPAHRLEGLTNPHMIKALRSCIQWCLNPE